MIVLDASAAVEWLLQTSKGAAIARRAEAEGTICAPHLIDLEVAQVVRRITIDKTLTPQRGGEAIDDLASMRLARFPHQPFLHRIWELRQNISAYDAAYIALAESLGVPLWTMDKRLASVPGHSAKVVVF